MSPFPGAGAGTPARLRAVPLLALVPGELVASLALGPDEPEVPALIAPAQLRIGSVPDSGRWARPPVRTLRFGCATLEKGASAFH